jgi:hypothetical protein
MTKRFSNLLILVTCLTVIAVSHAQIGLKQEIATHAKLAYEYAQIKNIQDRADSLSLESVQIAEDAMDDDMTYFAILLYLQRDKFGNLPKPNDDILQKAHRLYSKLSDPLKKFEFDIALANRLSHGSFSETAQQHAKAALSYAASINDDTVSIRALLVMAKTSLAAKDHTKAFDDLLAAQNLLVLLPKDEASKFEELLLLERLNFRKVIRDYAEASKIGDQLKDLYETRQPIDSINLMWSVYFKFRMASHANKDLRINRPMKEVIDYCDRTGNAYLEEYANSAYRRYLIENHQLDELYRTYSRKYNSSYPNHSEEWHAAQVCLDNALFCEYRNNPDSANLFFRMAIELAEKQKNKFRTATYRRLYGEYLMRYDAEKEAYTQFQKALELGVQVNYDQFIYEVSFALDSMAIKYGEYEKAHDYLALHLEKVNEINDKLQKDIFLKKQLDSKEIISQAKLAKYQESQRLKFNAQYFAIGIGLILLFVVFVIISSLTVPNWLIEMLGFFSILFIFEFIILILDHKIHDWAHGEPIKIFLVKIAILSFLFPLHHLIEKVVTSYLVKHQLIKKPEHGMIKKFLIKLYPWMGHKEDHN